MPEEIERFYPLPENQELEPDSATLIVFHGQGRKIAQVCEQLVKLQEHPVAQRQLAQVDEILHDLSPHKYPEGLTPILLKGTEEEKAERGAGSGRRIRRPIDLQPLQHRGSGRGQKEADAPYR